VVFLAVVFFGVTAFLGSALLAAASSVGFLAISDGFLYSVHGKSLVANTEVVYKN
jgi:hypothetical protein